MNKLLILPLTLLIFFGVLPLCFAQTHTITQITDNDFDDGVDGVQINDNGDIVLWYSYNEDEEMVILLASRNQGEGVIPGPTSLLLLGLGVGNRAI